MGDGVDQLGAVAVPRQADAEIGILGHVMRIPGAKPVQHVAAEEQRCAAQGHDQGQPGDPGQDQPEPARIFDGEAAA
jgi:hypothetical protein